MTKYNADTFKEGDKAFYVSKRKEVTVVKSAIEDGMLIVSIKGFDDNNPERSIRICPESPKGLVLKPITAEKETTAAAEPEQVEGEEITKAEEADEQTDTDADPLLAEWRRIGLSEELYHTLELSVITEIISRHSKAQKRPSKPGRRASTPSEGKLNVLLGKSAYLDASEWLEKHWRVIQDNEDEDAIIRDLFDTIALVPHACQYTGDVRRTRKLQVSDKAKEAITIVYQRLIKAYPLLLKYNLVEPDLLGD